MSEKIDKSSASEFLHCCEGMPIAIVGDIILDRYFWGSVSRISPEAPVPVIDVENETFHLGGAANVALNVQSLGCIPLLCGVVGADTSGEIIRSISEQYGMSNRYIVIDDARPTTVKTRIIGNNQHIVRLDREVRDDIQLSTSEKILSMLAKQDNLAGIIIEDYDKGVVSSELISRINRLASDRNIPVFVDPKSKHFFDFKGVTCFKPNRKEAQEALGYALKTDDDIIRAGAELLERLQCKNILITLGERGMMLFEQDGTVDSVPTRARHIADVSGAGDTAIATLAAMYVGGATMRQAARLANIASGLVCEEPGIVTIQISRLLDALAETIMEDA